MMDDNNVSNSLQVDKIPSMDAHRRMLDMRAPSGANGGSSKPVETAPEGDTSWEAGGSAHTAISDEEQNQLCEQTQQTREQATAPNHSSHSDSPAQGTLADASSRPNGDGAGGGVGLDSEDRGNSRTEQAQRQLSYHPDDVRSQAMGYAGRLSSIHEAALDALRQWLTRESVDLTPLLGDGKSCPPEDKDLALLRFLRHNKWDVKQAKTQMLASLSWRVETGVAVALRGEPWEASRCSSEETFEKLCEAYYPHYTIGVDRLGRPVLVQKYGTFNTNKLKQCTTLDGLLAYHAWEQEKNAELLRRSTARTGHLTETYTVIMDFKGMGIGLVGGDFRWLLRELSEMDRKHYPGRGGEIYVINTPPLFGIVWHSISHFMEATQARIHILWREHEWKAALAEAIDPSQLPKEYGGTAPALADTPLLHAVHRALDRETAVGATAEAVAAGFTTAEAVAAETVTVETEITAVAKDGLVGEETTGETTSGGHAASKPGLLDEETGAEATNVAVTGLLDEQTGIEPTNDAANSGLFGEKSGAEVTTGGATGLFNEETAAKAANRGDGTAETGLLYEDTTARATKGGDVAAKSGLLGEGAAAKATNGGDVTAKASLLNEETATEATKGDDIAAKTMAAILLHFSIDGLDWRCFDRNCTAVDVSTEGDGCGSIEGESCASIKGDGYGSGDSVVGDDPVAEGGVDSNGLENGGLAGKGSTLDPAYGISGGGGGGGGNRVCETLSSTDAVLEVTTAVSRKDDGAGVNVLQEAGDTGEDDSTGVNAPQEAGGTSKPQTRDDPPTSGSRDPTGTSGRSTHATAALVLGTKNESTAAVALDTKSESTAGVALDTKNESTAGVALDTKNESTAAGTQDVRSEDPAAGTKDAQNEGTAAGTQVAKYEGGIFGWFMNVIPGAHLAAGVVGTVAGNSFGASLHAAGYAAGVVQVVVPDCVWAEGVRAFKRSQSKGRQSCGR